MNIRGMSKPSKFGSNLIFLMYGMMSNLTSDKSWIFSMMGSTIKYPAKNIPDIAINIPVTFFMSWIIPKSPYFLFNSIFLYLNKHAILPLYQRRRWRVNVLNVFGAVV